MNSCEHFLHNREPVLETRVDWGRLQLEFHVACYLDSELPPHDLVTSVRAIVILNGQVVVLENVDGLHFLPGGRLEAQETYEEALRREVQEECGLHCTEISFLGFLHFRHLKSKPKNFPYVYPDWFQLVYSVTGHGILQSRDPDGYEENCYLYSPSDALALRNASLGHPFLKQITGIQHEN